jgi:hypothetical protein
MPVKEMLAHAPGFRSLYAAREIHFEEIYADIIDRAYRPPLRRSVDATRQRLLHIIQRAMDGRVVTRDEEFFLHNKQGNLEFTLLAEGIRKLALLWLLIHNGTLLQGAVMVGTSPKQISTLASQVRSLKSSLSYNAWESRCFWQHTIM